MKRKLFKVLSTLLCLAILCSIAVPSVFAAEENLNPITIYYPNGDWEYLPVELSIDDYDNRFLNALNSLVSGYNLPQGGYDEFPEGVKINKFEIEGKKAYVDVSKLLVDELSSKSLSTDVVRDILSYNIFNFDQNIDNIIFTFDGKNIDNFSNVIKKDFFQNNQPIDLDNKVLEKVKALKEKTKGMSPDQIRKFLKEELQSKSKETSSQISVTSLAKICVDPGHGGSDPGAVSGTTQEKTLNLAIAQWLKTYLESDGFSVVMTRSTDVYVNLTTRYTIANNNNADAFVSVHNNSGVSTARGTECIYPSNHDVNSSIGLATEVTNAIVDGTPIPKHRDPYSSSTLIVLKYTQMPAIIAECGFITNTYDRNYLVTSSGQECMGSSIELGVYFWWVEWLS